MTENVNEMVQRLKKKNFDKLNKFLDCLEKLGYEEISDAIHKSIDQGGLFQKSQS